MKTVSKIVLVVVYLFIAGAIAFALAGVFTGCQKQPKTLYTISFNNETSQILNFPDQCNGTFVQSGVRYYLVLDSDTIGHFQLDSEGTLSFRATQGHIIHFGGCQSRSLTILQ